SNVTIAANLDVDSFNLSVTDLTGKILMTKSLNGIENTVDISNLSSGAYFFELSSNTKKEVIKILKN
ncbi:MAG: T9SS type A sorting domain-containing protein, partial [Flavobacterium sp.]|nr:T9SS type A sorting domain-containing protein [Flavobacterium sp.]